MGKKTHQIAHVNQLTPVLCDAIIYDCWDVFVSLLFLLLISAIELLLKFSVLSNGK